MELLFNAEAWLTLVTMVTIAWLAGVPPQPLD
jgi:hypothetical protein